MRMGVSFICVVDREARGEEQLFYPDGLILLQERNHSEIKQVCVSKDLFVGCLLSFV